MGQLDNMIYHLEGVLEDAFELDEDVDEISLPVSFAEQILNVLKSQEVREPLSDVVFFAGKPTNYTVCYHVLINDIDLKAMESDPNIQFLVRKKYTGVMEKDHEPPVYPLWKGQHKAYCGACGKRLHIKYKPRYCHKCGVRIDYCKDGGNG